MLRSPMGFGPFNAPGIAAAAGEDGIKQRRMASVHLGIRMMKACISFWDDVAKHPPVP